MTSVFSDPFAPELGLPFAYWRKGDGWILVSAGPDRDYDIDPRRHYAPGSHGTSQPALLLRTYDPTNGGVSGGDIWRAGGGIR